MLGYAYGGFKSNFLSLGAAGHCEYCSSSFRKVSAGSSSSDSEIPKKFKGEWFYFQI